MITAMSLLFAARFSLRALSIGIWVVLLIGVVVGWLWRWIMDDSR